MRLGIGPGSAQAAHRRNKLLQQGNCSAPGLLLIGRWVSAAASLVLISLVQAGLAGLESVPLPSTTARKQQPDCVTDAAAAHPSSQAALSWWHLGLRDVHHSSSSSSSQALTCVCRVERPQGRLWCVYGAGDCQVDRWLCAALDRLVFLLPRRL